MDFLQVPWPWYVSGPMIALVMGILMWLGGTFGVSSNLRTLCSIGGAGRVAKFFDFNWKAQIWNLVFIGGAVIGGYLASTYMMEQHALLISTATQDDLRTMGFQFNGSWLPTSIFQTSSLFAYAILLIGGFLVGFGARYGGGCTSGHAISGLSNLQLPSLVAVIGFFIGGLVMTYLVYPIIFSA